MISMDKKYRTRNGCEVRIYATDSGTKNCVHGAVRDGETWRLSSWGQDGGVGLGCEGFHDLIEVKPRIKRTLWVNVFPNATTMYLHRLDADSYAGFARIACVKVEIDVEEGEGL